MKIDKKLLKDIQYKNPQGYASRVEIFNYAKPPFNPWQWLSEHYDFSSAKKILEVGSGTGKFWEYQVNKLSADNQLILTDFSQGMLDTTREKIQELKLPCPVTLEIADVEKLSYDDATFDAVLAHAMIYHTQSPEQALKEIKRVLKPTGWAGISTWRLNLFHELFMLANRVDSRFPVNSPAIAPFSEENADVLLPRIFSKIKKHTVDKTIEVPNKDVLFNFIKTHPTAQQLSLDEKFFNQFSKELDQALSQKGYVSISFMIVLYICSP